MNAEEIFNAKLANLYKVLLDYYTLLKDKDHPMIGLITDCMDNLIELRKSDEPTEERFNEINSTAFQRITEIYDYDKLTNEKETEEALSEEA